MTEQAHQRWRTVGLFAGWTIAALFAIGAHLRYVEASPERSSPTPSPKACTARHPALLNAAAWCSSAP